MITKAITLFLCSQQKLFYGLLYINLYEVPQIVKIDNFSNIKYCEKNFKKVNMQLFVKVIISNTNTFPSYTSMLFIRVIDSKKNNNTTSLTLNSIGTIWVPDVLN